MHGSRGAPRTCRYAAGQVGRRRTVRLLCNLAVKHGYRALRQLASTGGARPRSVPLSPFRSVLIGSPGAGGRQDSIAPAGDRQNPEDDMQRRGLVVDDEPVVCEMIRQVLRSAGMEALTLTRSTEAPEIIDEGKFDMVFLDLPMAYPDGIELARQMRSSRFIA